MKNILLIFCFIFVIPIAAKASCYDSWINSEERMENDQEMLRRAAFVGKIRLDSFEYIKEKRGKRHAYYLAHVTPMQTYYGALPDTVQASFNYVPQEIGEIYELLLFKDKYGYSGPYGCEAISRETLSEMAKTAQSTEAYLAVENECKKQNGQIEVQGGWSGSVYDRRARCMILTSDAGKICNDTKTCEGRCIVSLDNLAKEIRGQVVLEVMFGKGVKADTYSLTEGKCSELKNPWSGVELEDGWLMGFSYNLLPRK